MGTYVDDPVTVSTELGGWSASWMHHPPLPGDGLFTDRGRALTYGNSPLAMLAMLSGIFGCVFGGALFVDEERMVSMWVAAAITLGWPVVMAAGFVASAWVFGRARAAAATPVEIRVSGGQLLAGTQSLPLGAITHVVGGHGAITLFTDDGQLDVPNRGMAPAKEAELVLALREMVAAHGEEAEVAEVPESVRRLMGQAKQNT